MTSENAQAPSVYTLKEKYPVVAADLGIECGDGWYSVLDRMLASIQEIVPDGNGLRLLDVKSKYATLRVSYASELEDDDKADSIDKAIFLAECRAEGTCEISGQPGVLYDVNGWYFVASEEHSRGGRRVGEIGAEKQYPVTTINDRQWRFDGELDDLVEVEPVVIPAP